MLAAYAFVAGLGLLVGLRYKLPAAAAGSVTAVLVGTVAFLAAGWPIGWAFLAGFGASMAFQSGYFIGLGLNCAASRIGLWPFGARHGEAALVDTHVPTHVPTR
jgi:hypothetical protein